LAQSRCSIATLLSLLEGHSPYLAGVVFAGGKGAAGWCARSTLNRVNAPSEPLADHDGAQIMAGRSADGDDPAVVKTGRIKDD
jgi:membrane protein implicated in regulation of membrane protease activity